MTKKIDLSKFQEFLKTIASEKSINALRSFFMGRWYPIWIAFSVLIGRFTCAEIYFAMLDLVIVSIALLVCDSIRPVLLNLITLIYRIPIEHGPGSPYHSDYYVTNPGMIALIAFFALAIAALVCFYVKNKSFAGFNPIKNKYFIPFLAFSVTFFTAGMFSGNRQGKDLIISLLEFVAFFVVFYLLYIGLRRESFDKLLDYFVYIAAVCSVILMFELLDVFLRSDSVIINGSINKGSVTFGWGISNNMANSLSMLIPLLILGAMRALRKRIAVVYLCLASLTLLATVITLGRASVLVGGVGYIVALAIACFSGNHKKMCRIAALVVAVGVLAVLVLFYDKIMTIFNSFVVNGFNDNGRYGFWRYFYNAFKEAPVFGNGFYHFYYGYQHTTFAPTFAHNTIMQLLGSMGVVGLVSFLVYRAFTFIPFFKKFTLTKLFLFGSCAVLIFESWIDNFIFLITPTFVYNVCIILAVMHCEQTNMGSTDLDAQESAALVTELEGDAEEVENV